MFSAAHIVFMIIMIGAAVAAAVVFGRKYGWHKNALYICCAISAVSEIIKVFFFMEEYPQGTYLPQENLPFNLCSIQIIFIFMLTFSKSEKIKNALISFMYPTCLGGAIMALLIPTSPANYGFTSIISFQYFIYHGMLIFLSLYMIITKPIKFSMKSYFTALIMLSASLIFAIYLNSAFGNVGAEVNFFFVSRPPMDNLPILNVNHGWIVYILNLVWVAILLVSVIYIPVFIDVIKAKKANQITKDNLG